MISDNLLLGVDGGGTRCRARLCKWSGAKLAEAVAGPANIRLGLEDSIASVMQATRECLVQAGLSSRVLSRTTACLALAGASEPTELAVLQAHILPFGRTLFTTDAHAACVGAHCGRPGGIIVVGTGTVGWAKLGVGECRVGGWGFPVSDEGSGAWIGSEALRLVLWAQDGRIPWTRLLTVLFDRFERNPHSIVRFSSNALPRDFGAFAPIVVEHAKKNDPIGLQLMEVAARYVDALAQRLLDLGVSRLALVGGLAPHFLELLSPRTLEHMVRPTGDALDGALYLARSAAEAMAA